MNDTKKVGNLAKPPAGGSRTYKGPLKQIRAFCLDCVDGPQSVRLCTGSDCPLWPYRFGKHPKRVIREMGSDAQKLFDRPPVSQSLIEKAKEDQ
jgi:hypothetical protein